MKYLLYQFLLFPLLLFSQSTEISYSLEVGLFNFGGRSATEVSKLVYDQGNYRLANPFNRNPSLDIGFKGYIERIKKSGIIMGTGIGLNHTQSKLDVNSIENFETSMKVNLNDKI